MAGERKFTSYQDWVNLAREMAAKEQKALPWYQKQSLVYSRDITDVFGDQVTDLESASKFLSDFYLFHDQRLNNKTMKVKARNDDDVYNWFVSKLNIDSKDSNGQKRALKSVVTVGRLIDKAAKKEKDRAMKEWKEVIPEQVFISAFDTVRHKDENENKNQVYELFDQLRGKFRKMKSKKDSNKKVA